jgi:hypothetical protein
MKITCIKALLISVTLLSVITVSYSQYIYGSIFQCGVNNPTTAQDCWNHNLNTNITCCFMTNIPNKSTPGCGLVPNAAKSNLTNTYQNAPTFDCGISSNFITVSFSLIVFVMMLFL